jgi:tripartite-type tricarboxylate transporter receptor subunit TctC
MTRIMKMPDVNKAIANLDLIPLTPASVEDTQQYIAAEAKKWGDLVRKLGLAGSQ